MPAVSVKLNPLGIAIILICGGFIFFYMFGDLIMPQTPESKVKLKELLCASIHLARRGGERVQSIYTLYANNPKGKSKGKTKEGAMEMVTEGDEQSHHAMYYGFQKAFPGVQIISEEISLKPIDFKTIQDPKKEFPEVDEIIDRVDEEVSVSDITIWIDPLDATQEYTESLTEYVSVMVCVAIESKPVIGVIYHPFQNAMYWAWVGRGNSKSVSNFETDYEDFGKKSKNKINLNKKRDHPDQLQIVMSRSHVGNGIDRVKQAFKPHDVNITQAGGAGYKTLKVLSQQFDAYIHTTAIKKWDICASNAISLASNAQMVTLNGDKIDYKGSRKSGTTDHVVQNGLIVTRNDVREKHPILDKIGDLLNSKNKFSSESPKSSPSTTTIIKSNHSS